MVQKAPKHDLSLTTACLVLICSSASAEVEPPSRAANCLSQPVQPGPQYPNGEHGAWDDAKITRARSALTSLEVSQRRLVRLMGRLRAAEQSAQYAENFGRSGEANYWRRDVAQIRLVIDAERARAKPLAAEANVRCGGCTYSDLIAKMRKAIDEAVALRTAAAGGQMSTPPSAVSRPECSPKR